MKKRSNISYAGLLRKTRTASATHESSTKKMIANQDLIDGLRTILQDKRITLEKGAFFDLDEEHVRSIKDSLREDIFVLEEAISRISLAESRPRDI